MGWQREYQARKTKKFNTSDTPVVSTRSAKAPQRKKEALPDLQTQQAQAPHYGYNLSQVPVHPKHPTGAFGDTYEQEVALSTVQSQPEEQVPASQEESSFIQPRFGFDFTKIRIDADPTTVSMSWERAAQAHSADIEKRVQRKEEEPVKSESSALNIAAMSSPQKLEAALQHTLPLLPAEVRTKVEALLSPEALATIAAVAAVWAASHAVGIGEIADVALLGLGALAVGGEVIGVVQDVGGFVSTALQAQEEQDLDRAAEHLARAIATVGVDAVLAVLMHKAGNAAKDRLPGQPEMVTPEGMRVRAPEGEHHAKPLAIEAKQEGSSAEAIKQRMRELNAQGHGPARHGPHLTKEQLKDRALKGHDPVTGTTDKTVFKTAHYASRLEDVGINVARAESAVAKEVGAIRDSLATNADVVGRLNVDGILIEYRARLLPTGSVNVGTLFPVK
ncbi:hypothetical protein [Anthocerotibacter panamensis]|uniref:hypothetical protein n=1 Tax=Anthocerotibacter panamensis TaxID=2857077 RepID=UPI001C404AD7|nr:hypothetical protein [Anthocerotibacter panamensis]